MDELGKLQRQHIFCFQLRKERGLGCSVAKRRRFYQTNKERRPVHGETKPKTRETKAFTWRTQRPCFLTQIHPPSTHPHPIYASKQAKSRQSAKQRNQIFPTAFSSFLISYQRPCCVLSPHLPHSAILSHFLV